MAKSNAKSSKSNKTAHVLNLLTEPGETRESAPAGRSPAPAAAPAAHTDNSEEVAASIRDALEEDLLAQLAEEEPVQPAPAEAPPAPKPEPAPQPAAEEPQPEADFEEFVPESVAAASILEAPAAAPPAPEEPAEAAPSPEAPGEEAAAPQPAPEPEPAPQAKRPSSEDVTYFNVMQALVEDKVDKYMERFKMCRCHRCRTDVIALTLNSLPAKYIVIPEHEGVPMLTIYEGRYSAAVTAQIMWACQKVSEHPRHPAHGSSQPRLGAPRKDD